MRKQLPLARTPIHNSRRARSIGLLESEQETSESDKQSPAEYQVEIESVYPVETAVAISKTKLTRIVVQIPQRWKRRQLRRYVKACKRSKRPGPQRKLRLATKGLTYRLYVRGKIWEARRNRYWQSHPKECSVCGSSAYVQLHHMVYSTFDGNEPDSQLMPLCDDHHIQFHRENGTSGNMLEATLAFVEREQRSY